MSNLYEVCKHISSQSRAYLLGGGHAEPLSHIGWNEPLDCSSAVSLALSRTPYWFRSRDWAYSSGMFAEWGVPGRGAHFTVWYNVGHCWIQFHGLGAFQRFDTSPWGWGGRGPRVRKTWRPTAGFQSRHWPGIWVP